MIFKVWRKYEKYLIICKWIENERFISENPAATSPSKLTLLLVHVNGFFLCPPKTSKNLRFSEVFSGYWKRPMTYYGLIWTFFGFLWITFHIVQCFSRRLPVTFNSKIIHNIVNDPKSEVRQPEQCVLGRSRSSFQLTLFINYF